MTDIINKSYCPPAHTLLKSLHLTSFGSFSILQTASPSDGGIIWGRIWHLSGLQTPPREHLRYASLESNKKKNFYSSVTFTNTPKWEILKYQSALNMQRRYRCCSWKSASASPRHCAAVRPHARRIIAQSSRKSDEDAARDKQLWTWDASVSDQ